MEMTVEEVTRLVDLLGVEIESEYDGAQPQYMISDDVKWNLKLFLRLVRHYNLVELEETWNRGLLGDCRKQLRM